jgi:hypothetical protein
MNKCGADDVIQHIALNFHVVRGNTGAYKLIFFIYLRKGASFLDINKVFTAINIPVTTKFSFVFACEHRRYN